MEKIRPPSTSSASAVEDVPLLDRRAEDAHEQPVRLGDRGP